MDVVVQHVMDKAGGCNNGPRQCFVKVISPNSLAFTRLFYSIIKEFSCGHNIIFINTAAYFNIKFLIFSYYYLHARALL